MTICHVFNKKKIKFKDALETFRVGYLNEV